VTETDQINGTDTTSEAQAWRMNADRLATWSLTRMLNRDDVHGRYYRDEGMSKSCTAHGRVDYALIHRHFAADRIIGLHSTATDDTCRWLTVDIDRHDGHPEETAGRNERFSRHLFDALRGLGFDPLLADSKGRGGRHLTVLFDEPAPAPQVRAFGRWLVREWERFGLPAAPEVFPKQDSIVKAGVVGYGNYVRLFGRHHKRPHYSKVWEGGVWLEGEPAVEAILRRAGDPFALVPPEASSYQPPRSTRPDPREWWKMYRGDLKTLDTVALFKSWGLWASDRGDGQVVVVCPWAAEHTSGDDTARVRAADREEGLFPTFHCFHNHCEGRGIEEVLAFFGRDAVDRHCGRRFAAGDAAPVIDPSDPMGTARRYRESGGDGLIHHRGEWRRWDGRTYPALPEADVRAGLWNWLETCVVESKGASPYKPSRTAVNATIEALKAVANLPSTVGMPCWIGAGGGPRPEDVIAFANGLLDLGAYQATGEAGLLDHSPRWFSDNCLGHEFDPGASCPEWMKFLEQVFEGNAERVQALGQWFGCCLTGDTRLQKFAVLVGPSRSGKGTILRVLGALLGAENVANTSLTSLGSRFGLAPLVGKLAAVIGDGHLGRQADAVAVLERLKSITGGDRQNVDRKGAPELTNVEIKARFTVAVNELPRLPDASAALLTRMLVIPFAVSFAGREDHHLGDRLLGEIPGVTNWALAGLADLRREERLLQPRAGRAILDDFTRLSSPVKAFLEECCRVDPSLWTRSDALRGAWVKWCEANGHEPGSMPVFDAKLKAADPRIERPRRREGGGQPYGYAGVGLV
jgi:P4 family phage/plasmid primase-like protien